MIDHDFKYYVSQIMQTYFADNYIDRGNMFVFRCNVCGDSKTNKRKKRGHLFYDTPNVDSPEIFYCHNCQVSLPAKKWMREYFPDTWLQYSKEFIHRKKNAISNKIELPQSYRQPVIEQVSTPKLINTSESIIKPDINELIEDNPDMRWFKPIESNKDAIAWVLRRKIPESFSQTFFVSDNGIFRNRVIIPFIDNNENIYYFQARTLGDDIPKYKNPVSNIKPLFNIYNVDLNKPVIIFEGPIDSMFVENAIGLCGTSNDISFIKHKYYIYDNDNTGRKKGRQILQNSSDYVFMWKKFLNDLKINNCKDMNDVILNTDIKYPLTFEQLKPYFTNNLTMGIFV